MGIADDVQPGSGGESLAARWRRLRADVDNACVACGRDPAEVAILPVSKTFGVARIREALAVGLTRLGENRVQEIRDKQAELADAGIQWVVIGHLQTNKAKDVARLASAVESLDRFALAQALDRRLQHEGRGLDVLVEVKTSPEESKHGLPPAQLPGFLRELKACHSLHVRGLMTMAVNSTDSKAVRGCFRLLRELREHARDDGLELPCLSMGMSGDYHLAIAEGSTEIRIGRALFGVRQYA